MADITRQKDRYRRNARRFSHYFRSFCIFLLVLLAVSAGTVAVLRYARGVRAEIVPILEDGQSRWIKVCTYPSGLSTRKVRAGPSVATREAVERQACAGAKPD